MKCYRCNSWPCECADGITLILGDCREVLPLFEAGSFDAVVTDPPYGINADKTKAHSSIRDNGRWAKSEWDICRPNRDLFDTLLAIPSVAIWGGNYFSDFLPASSGWLAWIKPEAGTGFSLADLELCWTNKGFAARANRFPRRDGNEHPTQKPVSVMRWTLSFITGESILDPFAGSGTTLVAAKQLGRRATGIEIEEKYVQIAARRLEQNVLPFPKDVPPTETQAEMFP